MSDDPDHEMVVLLTREQLQEQSFELAEHLMAAITEFQQGVTPDARIVAAGCGLVAGYLFGIPDQELRRYFVDEWIEHIRTAAGTKPQ